MGSLSIADTPARKRFRSPNEENVVRLTKRQKLLGFNILSEERVGNIIKYTGYFTPESLSSFYREHISSTRLGAETGGEVYIIKGETKRVFVGTRTMVDIPTVRASYHVHPGDLGRPNTHSNILTFPSIQDITTYMEKYPQMQINFIFDINGVLIVDLMDSLVSPDGFLKYDPYDVLNRYTTLVNSLIANTRISLTSSEGYSLLQIPEPDLKQLFKKIRDEVGINIQYIKYSDIDKNVTVSIRTIDAL